MTSLMRNNLLKSWQLHRWSWNCLCLWILNVHCHILKTLSSSFKSNQVKIHLNIIIPTKLTFLNWHLPFRLTDWILCASPISLWSVNSKCKQRQKMVVDFEKRMGDFIVLFLRITYDQTIKNFYSYQACYQLQFHTPTLLNSIHSCLSNVQILWHNSWMEKKSLFTCLLLTSVNFGVNVVILTFRQICF